jgi:hypothetical protein
MIIALTYMAISIGSLLLLTVVYVVEDKKGHRVFLVSPREKLDSLLGKLMLQFERIAFSFTRGFMRLLLHYGAHSILKRTLALIRRLEAKVELLVRQNRKVAKDIGGTLRSNSHLGAIAEHKEEVSLSEKEKQQLRSH